MSARTKPGLAFELGVLVAVLGAALAAFLLFVVGPRTATAVERGTAPLVARSTATMEATAREDAHNAAAMLRTLIEHTSETRRATLADLPLDLYDGDPKRIEAAIARQDAALSKRLVENVDRLAQETEARALRRIAAESAALAQRQRELAEAIAADLQRTSLLLLGGALAVLLALLTFALHRLVIVPVRALQRAAEDVSAGRLDAGGLVVRGNDEVARLARAFAAMVEQLKATRAEVDRQRAELAALNAGLETEVARKTAALQQALDGLRATQRDLVLAERMASVGTLAGGIAHEFNNLAGGIRGCAREILAGETDPARREPLEVIVRAADRAIDVTDKLLRFARPRAPGSAAVDLAVLLREAFALVEPQARQQGVAAELDAAGEVRVRGDGAALHQVLVNLLGNALQAMPNGGTLRARAFADGGDAVLQVQDSGAGIAAADLDRIFDPFFTTRQSDAATPGRGAGLGLAVTYGIVQAHGGRIQVDSAPGAGSTFTVRLPLLRDGTPSAPPENVP